MQYILLLSQHHTHLFIRVAQFVFHLLCFLNSFQNFHCVQFLFCGNNVIQTNLKKKLKHLKVLKTRHSAIFINGIIKNYRSSMQTMCIFVTITQKQLPHQTLSQYQFNANSGTFGKFNTLLAQQCFNINTLSPNEGRVKCHLDPGAQLNNINKVSFSKHLLQCTLKTHQVFRTFAPLSSPG